LRGAVLGAASRSLFEAAALLSTPPPRPPADGFGTRAMSASPVPFLARPTFYYDRKAALLAGVYGAAMGILPVLAAKHFGASKMQIALLGSAPSASYLATLYWGHFVRQRRKLPVVVIAWSLARGLFLVIGLLTHLWPIILLACLSYFINAAAVPAYNAIWRHNYPTEVRGYLVGRVVRGNVMVIAVCTLVFGWLLDADPRLYRVLFPLAGACGVAAAMVFRRVKVRRGGTSRPPRPTGSASTWDGPWGWSCVTAPSPSTSWPSSSAVSAT